MNSLRKVLACVDQSRFAANVVDASAWAAQRLGAPLELLHILEQHPELARLADHSGTLGPDAQDHLLQSLSEEDALRSKSAREAGRQFLSALRLRAEAAGATQTDVRQRHGELVETLGEQEKDVALFVLGRRGEAAEHTQRDLGRSVERVVRRLRRPILAVTEDFQPPKRALLAFDGGPVTRRGVEWLGASPLLKDLPLTLLMAGKARQSSKALSWAEKTLNAQGLAVTPALLPGDPERVIAQTVREQEIDLLIMGAYSHSPLRSLIFGSKTSDLLRSATIPALLLR